MATEKKPDLTKTAAAQPPKANTPADTKSAAPRPPSVPHDPELGKTFKKVESGSAAPAKPAPRPGPGRPRKIPATGDAAQVAERPKNFADRPGTPSTFHVVAPKTTIDLEAKKDLSESAARTLIQTAAYLVGGIESLLCKVNLVDGLAIWKLSKIELDLVEGPGTRVMNKHLPAGAKAYADEIELASILAPIFLNRMYMLIAAKNPQLLAQILAAATGQGARPSEKTDTPPRPQAVPDKTPRAPAPRTTPEREMEHDAAAGDAAGAGMDPGNFAFLGGDGPDFSGQVPS